MLCHYCDAAMETKQYSAIGSQFAGNVALSQPEACSLCRILAVARSSADRDEDSSQPEELPFEGVDDGQTDDEDQSLTESATSFGKTDGMAWRPGLC